MFEISHLCYVSQIFIEIEVSGMRFLGCHRVYSELPQFQPLYEHQFRMAANVYLVSVTIHLCYLLLSSLITSTFVLL